MPSAVRDQVVVISGASSGVGRACARAFAEEGARVAIMARNQDALDVAASEVRAAGSTPLTLPVDTADADAVSNAAQQVVDEWGRIDIWVNCAMATVFSWFVDLTVEEYHRVTDVTYHGYVHGTMAALRHMRPRNEGRIIQIGSALAFRSIPLQSAYCGAKAAIRAFTDSLRTELMNEGSNIKISAVHLPAVNTPQSVRQRNKTGWQSQPVPPMFAPEPIAESVVWAAKEMPREMLVGWPTVRAVWGHQLFPALADWYLARNGVKGQLTDIKLDPSASDILYETLPGDPGAHGPYRDRERGMDWQMKLRMNIRPALAVTATLGAAALALLSRR